MADFFISYNNADTRWAEWIAWQLEEAGYKTIIQEWDFRPGENFALAMDRAGKEALRLIAILSPQYLKSQYTQSEWSNSFVDDPTGSSRRLIPIRVEDCKLDGLLRQIIYIDLIGLGEEDARSKLLSGIKEGRARPELPPPYPGRRHTEGETQPTFPGMETGLKQISSIFHQDMLETSITSSQPARGYQLFALGTSVVHPQYGIGEVIGVSGEAELQQARVKFQVGQDRTFIVSKSPLRPVKL